MPVTLTVNIIIELIKYYKKHAKKKILIKLEKRITNKWLNNDHD